MARHRQVGPLSQYHDLKTIDAFDVRDRLATLEPKLLLLRGVDDPGHPPEYEKEIHEAVPGSRYVKLSGAGHFPPTEIPDEVKGLVLMTVAARPMTRAPGTYEMRLRAMEDPKVYEEWLAYQRHAMKLVEPGLREQLMARHRQVGPLSQYYDLKSIDAFDVRDRLATLKPKLLLLRGMDDPTNPPEYEKEMHEAVPGSRYVKLSGAGHFPPTEIPDKVNALIEEFVATL